MWYDRQVDLQDTWPDQEITGCKEHSDGGWSQVRHTAYWTGYECQVACTQECRHMCSGHRGWTAFYWTLAASLKNNSKLKLWLRFFIKHVCNPAKRPLKISLSVYSSTCLTSCTHATKPEQNNLSSHLILLNFSTTQSYRNWFRAGNCNQHIKRRPARVFECVSGTDF